MVRCLIVDDSPRFLEAARGVLEREGITVVGVASNGSDAVQRVEELRPDLALLDIQLGGESGFDVARQLHRQTRFEPPRVIMISTHAGEDYEDLVAASPALGFVPKSELSARAILDVLEGRG